MAILCLLNLTNSFAVECWLSHNALKFWELFVVNRFDCPKDGIDLFRDSWGILVWFLHKFGLVFSGVAFSFLDFVVDYRADALHMFKKSLVFEQMALGTDSWVLIAIFLEIT